MLRPWLWVAKITTVEVFCICKMLWVWYHNKNLDLSMAECDTSHLVTLKM